MVVKITYKNGVLFAEKEGFEYVLGSRHLKDILAYLGDGVELVGILSPHKEGKLPRLFITDIKRTIQGEDVSGLHILERKNLLLAYKDLLYSKSVYAREFVHFITKPPAPKLFMVTLFSDEEDEGYSSHTQVTTAYSESEAIEWAFRTQTSGFKKAQAEEITQVGDYRVVLRKIKPGK